MASGLITQYLWPIQLLKRTMLTQIVSGADEFMAKVRSAGKEEKSRS